MTITPSNPRRVFFVRGTGSCGTSWVTALLNLHPHIYTCGEWCFAPIEAGVEQWEGQDWTWGTSQHMRLIVRGHLAGAVTDCLNAAAETEKPGATWVCDCSPEPIGDLVPGSPVILAARDGRDVLVSMTLRYLRRGGANMVAVAPGMASVCEAFEADPESVVAEPGRLLSDETWVRNRARLWAERVQHDLDALDRLQDEGVPALLLRYESLHTDTEACRAASYRLLGLNPGDALPLSVESKTTPGFKRGEDLTSFYRAGRIGDWQRVFTDETTRWFDEEATETLARLDGRAKTETAEETKPATALTS
jgi:hypothetical protein